MKEILSSLGVDDAHTEWAFNLANKVYAPYDPSHGVGHIEQVLVYARDFMGANMDSRTVGLVADTCVLHDAEDPKYNGKHVMTRAELFATMAEQIGEPNALIIFEAIDNMSFTKEREGRNAVVFNEPVRRLAQFADWLTSVGHGGVVKSLQYNKYRLGMEGANVLYEVTALWDKRFKHYLPIVEQALDGVDLPEEVKERVRNAFKVAHSDMEEILFDRAKMEKLYAEI
jgi:hypothetical protein